MDIQMNKNIIVCGDTHGYWRYLNALINKKKPELILQCGDWGFFPNIEDFGVTSCDIHPMGGGEPSDYTFNMYDVDIK